MTTRLSFNTGNPHKIEEATRVLEPLGYEVVSSAVPVTEPQADTLEAVALAKAGALSAHLDRPYMIEDAGLEVDALGGFPGVYSAYVLGTLGCEGLLRAMHGIEDRSARFRSVVAFVDDRGTTLHTGAVEGRIADEVRGDGGFGFDPVFIPTGHDQTFAELPAKVKDDLSHRGDALRALSEWLGARGGRG